MGGKSFIVAGVAFILIGIGYSIGKTIKKETAEDGSCSVEFTII